MFTSIPPLQRVATWLLENGANPNAYDEQGETPMHCVMRANHVDAALALQKGYGSVNLPRKSDWKTPLDLASESDEVGLLLSSYCLFHCR